MNKRAGKSKLGTLRELNRKGGPGAVARAVISRATLKVQKLADCENDVFLQRRFELSRMIDRANNSTIKHGPFAGTRFVSGSWGNDRGSMILGFYERELLEIFASLPPERTLFIDIGSADGYYAVGSLVGGIFDNVVCYEEREAGRNDLLANAKANGVDAKIEVRGTASEKLHTEFTEDQLGRAVVLVDIEGGEYDLFTQETFAAMSGAIVLIEVHAGRIGKGRGIELLTERSSKSHSATIVRTGARDPSAFPELAELTDNDRWLLCSEGRRTLGCWMRFDPLPGRPQAAA